MAKKAKAVEPEEEAVEETEDGVQVSRSQMDIHEGMVTWLEAEGYDLDEMTSAEVIALAFAKRNAWRKTDEYIEIKETAAERRETEREERAARKAAKAAEVEADEDDEEEAPAPKKAKKGKKAAAAAVETKAAKGGKKAKRKSKAADSDEDPFE